MDTPYQAIEAVLSRRESITALQARCTAQQRVSSDQQQLYSTGNRAAKTVSSIQAPYEQQCTVSDCSQQADNNIIQVPADVTKQHKLSAELLQIRNWRQQRQEAAKVIAAAVKDWLQRQKVQQQLYHNHLQWLKARRVLRAWQQQAQQHRQIAKELTAMQAAFSRALADARHAESHGFHATRICQQEGRYAVAAAYCEWRLRGTVLLAWAQQVLA